MAYSLPEDWMPEAEVSLRLAFHLLALPDSQGTAEVAIDGAQVFPTACQFSHIDEGRMMREHLCIESQGSKLV